MVSTFFMVDTIAFAPYSFKVRSPDAYGKAALAAADVNGAQFSSPHVDVLKNGAMNFAQMIKIKCAGRWILAQFQQPGRSDIGLKCVERRLVRQPCFVAKNAGTGIAVVSCAS